MEFKTQLSFSSKHAYPFVCPRPHRSYPDERLREERRELSQGVRELHTWPSKEKREALFFRNFFYYDRRKPFLTAHKTFSITRDVFSDYLQQAFEERGSTRAPKKVVGEKKKVVKRW